VVSLSFGRRFPSFSFSQLSTIVVRLGRLIVRAIVGVDFNSLRGVSLAGMGGLRSGISMSDPDWRYGCNYCNGMAVVESGRQIPVLGVDITVERGLKWLGWQQGGLRR
jgi:hypothetical protein